uniref:Uncharacterized protein n=1 Tax=Denticeps clupeoides TaxID=299321 RepID=A0AAY4BMD2_9TELE
MHPLDDVSAVVEDAADVLGVDGTGEVGVTVVSSIPARCADPLQGQSLRAACLEVLLNFGFPCQNLLSKQVLFRLPVEETSPVIPDVLKEVQCLLETVGLIVFSDDHVVAAACNHKYYGRHISLNPFPAFIPLTSHIEHAEKVGKTHCVLITILDHRITGQDSQKQTYLIGWSVVALGLYSLLRTVDQLVLIGSLEAGPHPFVLPQEFGVFIKLLKKRGHGVQQRVMVKYRGHISLCHRVLCCCVSQ